MGYFLEASFLFSFFFFQKKISLLIFSFCMFLFFSFLIFDFFDKKNSFFQKKSFHFSPSSFFPCVSFRFLFLVFSLRFFSLFLFLKKICTFGQVKSNARRHRPTNQSFRVCKVNLATIKVASRVLVVHRDSMDRKQEKVFRAHTRPNVLTQALQTQQRRSDSLVLVEGLQELSRSKMMGELRSFITVDYHEAVKVRRQRTDLWCRSMWLDRPLTKKTFHRQRSVKGWQN